MKAFLRFKAYFLVALLCCCPGCLACYTTRTVDVTLTSRNTGQPLVNTPVKVAYACMFILNAPQSVSATTDNKGSASLRMADFRNGIILVSAGDDAHPYPDDYIRVDPSTVREGGVLALPQMLIRLTPRSHWVCSPFERLRDLISKPR
jgi:hypothetical protein